MRGLCKTSCGYEIEYEPHEFSDGFVYYLPRNLDGKVHNCIFSEEDGFFDYEVDTINEFCQKHKERLKISPEDVLAVMDSGPMNFFDESIDLDLMDLIRKGKVFELKKFVEKELSIVPMPYLAHRLEPNLGMKDEQEIFLPKATQEQIIGYTWIELPTDNGYQLEYLGKIYELMIRLEDAKKCYELQYECTKEPELLDVIKELDEKIKKRNETKISTKNIPDNITSELMKNSADETEEKLGQYVVALFSNDMNKIWKRLPGIYRQIQEIRKKEQESIIPIKDKTDVERLSLGMLNTILRESMSKKKSNSDGKCEKCGKMWKAYDYVFLANKSKENEFLICSNEVCFKDQGGLVSDASLSLLNYIYIIKDARNANSHKRNYDQVMLQNVFRTAMNACTTVNDVIEDYLDKKNLV